jgi:hypothetical protein
MEKVKLRPGDYYIVSPIDDDDSEEKIFITEVNYVKDEIKLRYEKNIEIEYSNTLSNHSNTVFCRTYNIIEVEVFDSFLLATLTQDAFIQLSESIFIFIQPEEDKFLIGKDSYFYNNFIREINLNSSQITLTLPYFSYGKAVVNGRSFYGFIDYTS